MRRASPTRASTRCSTVARERGASWRPTGSVSGAPRRGARLRRLRGERARAASGPRRDRTVATRPRGSQLQNAQPLVVNLSRRGKLAIAHNGNLVNALALRDEMEGKGSIFQTTARYRGDPSPDRALVGHRDRADDPGGARALPGRPHVGSPRRGEADRRPGHARGFRPLCLGAPGRGPPCWPAKHAPSISWGADLVREIEPGEMVIIDGNGVRSFRIFKAEPARACVFELIYFSRPDSVVFGQSVDLDSPEPRQAAGRRAPGRRRHRDLACRTPATRPRLASPSARRSRVRASA